jgi:5-methylcytosine-specific restriction enzyme subunit McrC
MAQIPVQNVYYLLCYAWDQMEAGPVVETGATGHTTLADLFGQVLANGTKRMLRQGLDRGYVTRERSTARIRGRVDFNTSVRRALLPRAKAYCAYDELSRNVLHNRILRSTIQRLLRVSSLSSDVHAELRLLDRRLGGIDSVPLTTATFGQVQLHAGNAFYRFLINVCELVAQNVVPTEDGTGCRFRDFRREDAQMGRLFESFVRHFYAHEQDRYAVNAPHIPWDLDGPPPEHLPSMRTDMVLRSLTSPQRALIIDTKYYSRTLQSHHGTQSYHSDNLYQLFAYLTNAEAKGPPFKDAEGMLLYPTIATTLNESFSVQGHRIHVRTIDLAKDWHAIRDDLLALIPA